MQPYLSQHLLLGLAPRERAPECRGACRCGASSEEWHELPVLVSRPISAPIREMGGSPASLARAGGSLACTAVVYLSAAVLIRLENGPDFLEPWVTHKQYPLSETKLATMPEVAC